MVEMGSAGHSLREYEPAAAAAEWERAELARQTARLTGGEGKTRAAAARELRAYGPPAVEPLCRALGDAESPVRLAALAALAEVGDERALEPLADFLRRQWPGRKAWRTVAASIALPVIAAGVLVLNLHQPWAVFLFELSLIGGVSGRAIFDRRRESGELQAAAEALAAITERCPRAEVRVLLPELDLAMKDALQYPAGVRRHVRQAAARMERVTAHLQALPIAAEAASGSEDRLPRVAPNPQSDAATAPRPVE